MPASKTPISSHRALEIWPVLMKQAMEGQTITYGQLALKVGIPRAPLALIASLNKLCAYCRCKSAPLVPVLVVSLRSGKPSGGSGTYPNPCEETQAVYRFDWTRIPGPALTDLD